MPDIRDLAVIGDRRTAAVIDRKGDILWYCPERFDRASLFAALLDPKAGAWRVVDYIEAHLAEDISFHDLAVLAGLSTHHFGEAFKASTGTSPHRYLIERRILRAKELLLGAEQSIAEIAISVGFASHSHFTDNFRRLTGTTPSRFRIDRS